MRFVSKPLGSRTIVSSADKINDKIAKHEKKVKKTMNSQSHAWEVWEEWCRVTRRPSGDEDNPPKEVIRKITKALNKNNLNSEIQLKSMVYLSSLLTPAGDPHDTERLIGVLSYTTKRNKAEEARSQGGSPIFWMDGDTEEAERRVRQFLGYPNIDDMTQKEKDAVLRLNNLSDKTLEQWAQRAKQRKGTGWVFPLEAEEYGSSRVTKKETYEYSSRYKKPELSDPYEAGKNAAEQWTSDHMEMDVDAEKMIISGYSQEEVVRYHNMAPQNYWSDVNDLFENNDYDSIEEVYDELKAKYDWHPENRK